MVVDTDVYSQLYVRQGATAAPKQALKDMLVGRSVAIAVQTRAELLIWPEVRGWSADRRPSTRAARQHPHGAGRRAGDRGVRADHGALPAHRPCAGAEAARRRSMGGRHRDRHQPAPCSQVTASTSTHLASSCWAPSRQPHRLRPHTEARSGRRRPSTGPGRPACSSCSQPRLDHHPLVPDRAPTRPNRNATWNSRTDRQLPRAVHQPEDQTPVTKLLHQRHGGSGLRRSEVWAPSPG